jgi:hypothetical protein
VITVTRTRLDDGAVGVARATARALDLALDERHITAAGAIALEQMLNGLVGAGAPQVEVESGA